MRIAVSTYLFFLLALTAFSQTNIFPSSGNVGIGTTVPGAKLSFRDVNFTSEADGITWLNSSPLDYGIFRTPGSWSAPNYQQLKLQFATGIVLDPGASYGKSYVDILGEGLRVTSGNVGIGTTQPNYKLHIVDGNGGGQLKFQRGTGVATIDQDININDLYITASAGLLLNYNGGNVAIGKLNPLFKLDVAGVIASDISYLGNSADAGNNYTRSNFGSNAYWDPVVSRWQIRAIGNNDFSSIIHPNGDGLAFITAPTDGNVAKSLTNGQFMAYERMRITSSGNVGIGTSSPFYNIGNSGLHIDKGNHSMILLGSPVSNSFGGVVQTSDNKHRVFIGANLYDDPNQGWKNFQTGKGGAGISILADNGNWGTSIDFYTSNNNNEITPRMTINGLGNVAIGTLDPKGYKLAVAGNIISEEVVVKLQANWPDYVFEKNYKLPSLEELQLFIAEHRHLPGVPSSKEIEENGLPIGEMNAILLKKIEELTMYLIEQKKINDRQEKLIEKLLENK